MKLDLEDLADKIIRVEYPTYEQTTIPQMKSSIIRKKEIIKQILEQRIKQACEFYLKYMNRPWAFKKEVKDIPYLYDRDSGTYLIIEDGKFIDYNEWLFKLAFNLMR